MSSDGDVCNGDRAMQNEVSSPSANDDITAYLGIDPSAEVHLVVGSAQRKFTINEQLICNFCPFFRNAFNGSFIEAQTKTLTLPDDDPERFVELIRWLLDGGFPSSVQTWKDLATTWFFADKYHIDKLQNAVIDSLYSKFASKDEGVNISFETLDFIAENTSDNRSSPLRRMFADVLTNGISLQHLPNRLDQIPAEFLQDMVLALKRTVSLNGPTNISLLTNPIASYYSLRSDSYKPNASPATAPLIADVSSGIYCDGIPCRSKQPAEPIKGIMHICTNHNLTLCHSCRHSHYGHHRKKLFTFTTAPYRDAITGDSIVIDGHINDSGFYCDGPKCDPENKKLTHETWALMSGDRYHCMECDNIDYCSVCVRGGLSCKTLAHSLLRIRPTCAKYVPLTAEVNIKTRQERVSRDACWRCGSEEHVTGGCKDPVVPAHLLAVEE